MFCKNIFLNDSFRVFNQLELRHKKLFILLLILSVISTILEIISIATVLPLLTILTSPEVLINNSFLKTILIHFNIRNQNSLFLPILILFASLVFFSIFFRLFIHWFHTTLSFKIFSNISTKMFNNYIYRSYLEHVNNNSSEVVSSLSFKSNSFVFNSLMPIVTIFSSLFFLFSLIICLLLISIKVTITISVVFLFSYLIIFSFIKKKLDKHSKEVNLKSDRVIKEINEGLGSIRDIILYGVQDLFISNYKKSDETFRNAQSKIIFISGIPKFLMELIVMLMIIITIYLLYSNSQNNISRAIPVIGTFVLSAQRLLPIVQQIFTAISSKKGGKYALYDALEILEYSNVNNVEQMSIFNFAEKFELKNVSFSYPTKKNTPLLSNINIKIKKGEKIGIIGKTGTGKSTLMDIMMGLLMPDDGNLFIDNQIIGPNNIKNFQSIIAHVPQTIYLVDASFAENIAFGIPYEKINFDKVKEVSIKSKIHDVIMNSELKYNTQIGENGVKLSGGQRQRLGIARALYRNAQIIFLDESTSALDSITESEIMEQINNLNKDLTIIIVAHRISTLDNCDSIYNLENGSINKLIINKIIKNEKSI